MLELSIDIFVDYQTLIFKYSHVMETYRDIF